MKRSQLRRMSSTPIPEFDIDMVKVKEPEMHEGKTGTQFLYVVSGVQPGPDGAEQLGIHIDGPCDLEPIVEEHPRLVNTLNVSVVPLEAGEYKLYIYHRGQQFFVGQPIQVHGEKIYAEDMITKVRVFGRNSEFGRTQQINEFSLDTTECPMKVGGLILSIKGKTPRTAAKLYLTDHHNGVYTIGYKPTSSGTYLLTVKMAGCNVPGSPFTIEVVD